MGIPDNLTCLLRICMQVKKQQLELYMEQLTGSKLGKECIKAVYCHHASLTFMQNTSCEMLDWMKHKLESRLNIWKFTVHVLLKPDLENFEHYFTRVCDDCTCAVV